jgi:voltage-gated potassium channel
MYPLTALGKVIGGVIALLGIGLVALPTGIISSGFMEEIRIRNQLAAQQEKITKKCPHCGLPLDD